MSDYKESTYDRAGQDGSDCHTFDTIEEPLINTFCPDCEKTYKLCKCEEDYE